METCTNCHSESQELWAIGPPYPVWEPVAAGDFVELQRCAQCGQLWLESFYEPFAAFRYAVKWPGDQIQFESERDRDQSSTLCKWHEAQVRLMGNAANEETMEFIKAHYRRSRGHVNLLPSKEPNPITLSGVVNAQG